MVLHVILSFWNIQAPDQSWYRRESSTFFFDYVHRFYDIVQSKNIEKRLYIKFLVKMRYTIMNRCNFLSCCRFAIHHCVRFGLVSKLFYDFVYVGYRNMQPSKINNIFQHKSIFICPLTFTFFCFHDFVNIVGSKK